MNVPGPRVVNIQVARTCNLRCTFCSHDVWAHPTGLMEWTLFEETIAKLKADGCPAVAFVAAQGEALLHPRIFDMIEAAMAASFETNVVTNGTPLNERRVHRLVELAPHSIQVSFCGYDKETYERAYVGGRFDRVSANLALLIRLLKESGGRTALSINGVVAEDVADPDGFLALTAAFLFALGAEPQQVRLQRAHNWGGTVEAGRPRGDPPIWSHRELAGVPLKMCPLLVSTPGVYVDGRVTACGCIDANGALEIGHIREQGIAEIRRGSRYQAMVSAFEAGDVSSLPLCRDCEIPYGLIY